MCIYVRWNPYRASPFDWRQTCNYTAQSQVISFNKGRQTSVSGYLRKRDISSTQNCLCVVCMNIHAIKMEIWNAWWVYLTPLTYNIYLHNTDLISWTKTCQQLCNAIIGITPVSEPHKVANSDYFHKMTLYRPLWYPWMRQSVPIMWGFNIIAQLKPLHTVFLWEWSIQSSN